MGNTFRPRAAAASLFVLRRRLFPALQLGLGLALLGWLVASTPLQSLARRLLTVEAGWLVLAWLCPHLAILLNTIKWQGLLRVLGVSASLGRLLVLYAISIFVSTFVPSHLGGDAFRAFRLQQQQGRLGAVVAATFMERYIGFAALITLLPFALLRPELRRAFEWLSPVVPAIVFGYAALTWLLFRATGGPPTGLKPERGALARARTLVAAARVLVSRYRDAHRALLTAYALSLGFNLLTMLTVWLTGMAVGITLEPTYLAAAVPLVLLAGSLPISARGVGIVEGAYVVVLGLAGVSRPDALTVALLLRARAILTAALGGAALLLDAGRAAVVMPRLEARTGRAQSADPAPATPTAEPQDGRQP